MINSIVAVWLSGMINSNDKVIVWLPDGNVFLTTKVKPPALNGWLTQLSAGINYPTFYWVTRFNRASVCRLRAGVGAEETGWIHVP